MFVVGSDNNQQKLLNSTIVKNVVPIALFFKEKKN